MNLDPKFIAEIKAIGAEVGPWSSGRLRSGRFSRLEGGSLGRELLLDSFLLYPGNCCLIYIAIVVISNVTHLDGGATVMSGKKIVDVDTDPRNQLGKWSVLPQLQ